MMFDATGLCLRDRETGLKITTRRIRLAVTAGLVAIAALTISNINHIDAQTAPALQAQDAPQAPAAPVHTGGEANLIMPDLSQVSFLGVDGRTLLMVGLLVCALGLLFGLVIYTQLKNMPVHASMLEVSELIYETCKTYLIQQGKLLLILELFIGTIIFYYYFFLLHFSLTRVSIILFFSLVGIAGSFGVAWFGIRVNTFANSRTAFASLRGKPYPC